MLAALDFFLLVETEHQTHSSYETSVRIVAFLAGYAFNVSSVIIKVIPCNLRCLRLLLVAKNPALPKAR